MKHFNLKPATLAPAFAAALWAFCAAGHAAPAETAPAFGWPFGSSNRYVTAAFDLDRATGSQADWTGWFSGEATAGSGHAYDNHAGHDYGMPTGSDLYAVANGRVNAIRESVPNDDHSDTGNYLIVDHKAATGTAVGGKDYRSRYWHLAQNGVIPSAVGTAVTKGAQVADSDNTGNSTGPHLHYGISLLPSDQLTCAFYHGWWENDEFFTHTTRPCIVYLNTGSDFLNCREGASAGYNIITSFPPNTQVVATQQNNWWRVMLPLPPASVGESRTVGGGLASGYSEAGVWSNLAEKSGAVSATDDDPNRVILEGAGSRASTFATTGDAADFATFNFTMPYQAGLYDVYATWPKQANAANVTYRVAHAGGTTDVPVNQNGNLLPAGIGTKANPYLIARNPFVVNHTTVGAPDEWNLYTPEGSNLPQQGPENLYKFTLTKPGTVTVTVDHAGYPTKDIDLHLLSSANPATCFLRANWTMTTTLATGTYYLACDSYGTGAAGELAASPYKLTVSFSEDQPFPDSWVKLGQFNYTAGAAGSVQVREAGVTGRIDGSVPGQVVADAIKLVPRITRRTGWISNGIATRINTATTPVSSVLIKTDATSLGDSNDISEFVEVPIYTQAGIGQDNPSPLAGKAVTGQRFVCTGRAGDWYRVSLTNGTAAASGWILGDHLIGWNMNQVSEVQEWSLYD